jgi:hypothetical protein
VKPWDTRNPQVAALLKRKGLEDMIPGTPRRRNGTPEENEQRRVVTMLDRLLPAGGPVFWSATLNGVRVATGLRARLKGMGLRPGVLDLVFIPLVTPVTDPLRLQCASVGVAHWIEMKTEKGRLSTEQQRLFDTLYPMGLAQVCRTAGEVEDQLRTWRMIP